MDKRVLIFCDGVWKPNVEVVREPLLQIDVPTTIQEVIASRIDLLPSDDKEVLQTASVIGPTFQKSILEYSAMPIHELPLHLENLEDLEFIYKRRKEYVFKHPLIREVAYNMLLKRRRRELHKKVGECIERLFKDRIADFYELLSHHYYTAQIWDKAYDHSVKSATSARKLYRNLDAIRAYDRAIECLKFDAPITFLKKKKIEILQKKASVLAYIGEPKKSLDILDEALSLSREINDKSEEAECLLKKSGAYSMISQDDRAIQFSKDSLLISREINDKKKEAWALVNIGIAHSVLGKYNEFFKYIFDALNLIKGDKDEEIRIYNTVGVYIYSKLCNWDKALEYYLSALKIIEEKGDKRAERRVLYNIARVYLILGDYNKALRYLKASLKIAKEIGYKGLEPRILQYIGSIYFFIGKFDEALNAYTSSLKTIREIENKGIEGNNILMIGEIYQIRGNWDLALRYYNDALNIAKEIGLKRLEISALIYIGNVHREEKSIVKALEHYTCAKEIVEKIHEKENMYHLESSLNEFALENNDITEAERHINSALKLAEEMWVDVYKREIILLLARLNFAKGEWEEAKLNFDEALKLFTKINYQFKLAETYYYFGNALREMGDESRSSEYLSKSKRLFKSMGANGWFRKFKEE